jgi:hypothetical protein
VDLQNWLFIVTAAAAVGQVGALIAMVLQLKDFRKQTSHGAQATRDSTRISVWLEMIAIDKFFCEHPQLRELFYGPSTIHPDPNKAQQVAAAAEMLLDFAECMMTQKQYLRGGFDGWREYYQTLFTNSPTLRKYWQENQSWFQDDMQDTINDMLRNMPQNRKETANVTKQGVTNV